MRPRLVFGFHPARSLMRKLTWLGSILLTLVVCSASVSHAQKVRYEYAGPLDGLETLPLRDVVTASPSPRVARLAPVKQLRPSHPGVSSAVVGRITRASTYSPVKQTAARMTRQAFVAPPSPQVIREALPLEVPSPTFGGPLTRTRTRSYPVETNYVPRQQASPRSGYGGALTDAANYPVEPEYIPRQDTTPRSDYGGALTEPTDYPVEPGYTSSRDVSPDYEEYEYAGALTDTTNYPMETGYISGQQDPTRFGYRDGKSFGFEGNRLYNPLEGPQLDLQGAPTANLGEPGCDEWEDFCRGRDLEQDCGCGGLKANPGHLGLPWLGSKDSCDQTVPLFKRRGGCKKCRGEESCENCGACPTCGK